MAEPSTVKKDTPIAITAHQLPLYCPLPDAPLWARHPRVFLDIAETGETMCLYCGTRYVLEGGPRSGGH